MHRIEREARMANEARGVSAFASSLKWRWKLS
jgi:hypothetical protein